MIPAVHSEWTGAALSADDLSAFERAAAESQLRFSAAAAAEDPTAAASVAAPAQLEVQMPPGLSITGDGKVRMIFPPQLPTTTCHAHSAPQTHFSALPPKAFAITPVAAIRVSRRGERRAAAEAEVRVSAADHLPAHGQLSAATCRTPL